MSLTKQLWLAIGLVLSSALIHAGWNYLLKKSGGGSGAYRRAAAPK